VGIAEAVRGRGWKAGGHQGETRNPPSTMAVPTVVAPSMRWLACDSPDPHPSDRRPPGRYCVPRRQHNKKGLTANCRKSLFGNSAEERT